MVKRIIINLTRQVLMAYDGGKLDYQFDCASGDRANPTPPGRFQIGTKNRFHFSSQYKVPMNYAMFFNRGIAIHQAIGVRPISYLKFAGFDSYGSHGCVRLSEHDASILFDWTPLNTSVDVIT
jgi:lipoprotein-anchoring transpeptidase ErfK/SrfK